MTSGMKRAWAVLLMCVTAVAQQPLAGHGQYAGKATFGVSSGAPLAYNARTDTCVTGSESGCTGLGLAFQLRSTDTVPFTGYPATSTTQNIAGGYTLLSTDSDFHGYEIMASDWTIKNANTSFNAETPAFNLDSTMVMYTSQGANSFFVYMSKTTIQAAEAVCGTSCQNVVCNGCVTKSQITSSSSPPTCSANCTVIAFSGGIWSRKAGEANVLYELDTAGLHVYRDAICRAGSTDAVCSSTASDTFTRTLYLDLTGDTPVACSILPASYTQGWNGTLRMANDGSLTIASAGAGDWAANTAYTYPDSFIFPQTNNGGSPTRGFQTTTGGVSGSTEPNWNANCATAGSTCTDGTVVWTNIGSLAAQGSGFDLINYTQGVGCSRMNTRIGKIYRGSGVSTAAYPDGALLTDDDQICAEYGVSYPATCPLPDKLTIHDGGSLYDSTYASFTPGGSAFGAGGSLCTGGAAGTCSCTATNAHYSGAYDPGSTYSSTTHDTVYDPANVPHSLYVAKTSVPVNTPPPNSTYWNAADTSCYTYVWQVRTNVVRPCMYRGSTSGGHCDAHQLTGYQVQYKGAGLAAPYTHLWARPSVNGAANPGIGIMPGVTVLWDHHGVTSNVNPSDTAPVGIAYTDVPGSNYQAEGTPGASQNLPYYDEFVMVKTGYTTQPSSATVWRIAHEYNTGSTPSYSEQNNFASVSQDGQWALVGSDLMGTRGSRSGDWVANHAYGAGQTIYPTSTLQNLGNNDFVATTAGTSGGTEPNWDSCTTTCTDGSVVWTNLHKSCNQLRGLYSPIANQAFSSGETIFPVSNNSNFSIYQATAGTTSSPIPNWNTAAPNDGDTVTDGTVVWTNIGTNDCRSDVFLVDMMSAH